MPPLHCISPNDSDHTEGISDSLLLPVTMKAAVPAKGCSESCLGGYLSPYLLTRSLENKSRTRRSHKAHTPNAAPTHHDRGPEAALYKH